MTSQPRFDPANVPALVRPSAGPLLRWMGRRRNLDPLPWLNEEMEGQQRGDHHHPIRFFPASPLSRSGRAGIHERVKVYKNKKSPAERQGKRSCAEAIQAWTRVLIRLLSLRLKPKAAPTPKMGTGPGTVDAASKASIFSLRISNP